MGGMPLVIEVAINGATPRDRNPAVPVEPDEVAADALRCLAEGAAVVHTHSDRPALPPAEGAARYAEAYRPILSERPDAILYPTIAPADDPEARHGHQRLLARDGLIRQGILDPGAVLLSAAAEDGLPGPGFAYVQDGAHIRTATAICRECGLGPSIAIFEPGWLRVVLAAHRAGALPPGAFVKLYFSAGGYFGGGEPTFSPPPIREALELYLAMLRGSGLPFAVAVLGGDVLTTEVAELALARGGHLRVGLEDDPGARDNATCVARARELGMRHGRAPASPADAARLLGLPGPLPA